MVELRLKLADAVKLLRKVKHVGLSKSCFAKVEAAADSVSLDLLIRSYLARAPPRMI